MAVRLPPCRLARLLLDWGRTASTGKPEMRFTMALTHEEIANMAGTSRETVTRTLSDLRQKMLITVKGPTVVIRDKAALEALSMLGMAPSEDGEEAEAVSDKEPSHPNIQKFMRTA